MNNSYSPNQAQNTENKQPNREQERLTLEIKERKWNVSWVKFVHLITPIAFLFSVCWGIYTWRHQIDQQKSETKRLRQQTIDNHLQQFSSDNLAIRIVAARSLARYPEVIPVLISSLGSINLSTKEEETQFTDVLKTSLRQIGKDALMPLLDELRRIQSEIKDIFIKNVDLKMTFIYHENVGYQYTEDYLMEETKVKKKLYLYQQFSLYTALKSKSDDIMKKLKAIPAKLMEEEIESIIANIQNIKTSRTELVVANKNIVEIIANLLGKHDIAGLDLSWIDLSGANLTGIILRKANLKGANLSNAILNHANLSNSILTLANLSGAILDDSNLSNTLLMGANLSHASIIRANLFSAVLWDTLQRTRIVFGLWVDGGELFRTNLTGADLREAKLTKVKGFENVKIKNANLGGVEGLSEKDKEYARNEGVKNIGVDIKFDP